MSDEQLASIEEKLDRLLTEKESDNSPWLRGDEAAAKFAGYNSRRGFLRWAQQNRVRPRKDEKINFWDKAQIVKARKKQEW